MSTLDVSEWHDLFVASAGASAALTGLVFVAVSINIEQILRLPGLPERALATLMLLLGALVISLLPLMPQGTTALGVELLAVGLALLAVVGLATAKSSRAAGRVSWRLQRGLLAAVGTVPFVIGGISILAGTGGELYWIAGGVIAAIVAAVVNAWVLLVEILR